MIWKWAFKFEALKGLSGAKWSNKDIRQMDTYKSISFHCADEL